MSYPISHVPAFLRSCLSCAAAEGAMDDEAFDHPEGAEGGVALSDATSRSRCENSTGKGGSWKLSERTLSLEPCRLLVHS